MVSNHRESPRDGNIFRDHEIVAAKLPILAYGQAWGQIWVGKGVCTTDPTLIFAGASL